MSRDILFVKVVLLLFAVNILSAASEAEPGRSQKYQLDLTGLVGMDVGQMVKAAGLEYQTLNNYKPWIHEPLLTLMLKATLNERLQLFAGMGAQIWYNTINQGYSLPRSWMFQKYTDVFVDRAEGVASFPNNGDPVFKIGVGIFPYKYNEDVRNLGEYLFRSTAYPALVNGGFENAFYRLTGLRASLCSIRNLRADLILSIETETQPYHDFSLAAVADYDIANIVKIGAGVQFYHLIPVDPRLTTPDSSSGKAAQNTFIDADGQPDFYTHRGIKMMGRLRFDPKRIFARDGDFGIWGKEDFKIYGEVDVLGVKSYPDQDSIIDGTPRDPYKGYNRIMEKMPITFGINVPTTKWGLDVLALEAEWFGIPYANDPFQVFVNGLPRMMPIAGNEHLFALDNWKWTIYAKRHLGEHFFMTLMFARDHAKLRTINSQYYEYVTPDVLLKPEDWWWVTRVGYEF